MIWAVLGLIGVAVVVAVVVEVVAASSYEDEGYRE